jgi:hypothetical protein
MNSQVTNNLAWREALESKARLIINQVADLRLWANNQGCNEEQTSKVCEPYYKLLRTIYEYDFPQAHAIEDSDLLIRYVGPSLNVENPRLSLISGLFRNVREQVTDVAKAISGLTDRRLTGHDIDLGLSAFARGSLFLGFTLAVPDLSNREDEKTNLLGEEDPLFRAAQQALESLGLVIKDMVEDDFSAAIARDIPDPAVRDTAISAVNKLIPLKKTGVESITVGGRQIISSTKGMRTLKTEDKVKLRGVLSARPKDNPKRSLEGRIREIDLDSLRFSLRQIKDYRIDDLRCSYLAEDEAQIRSYLGDKVVQVSGRLESAPDDRPRLLHVETISELSSSSTSKI